MSGEITAPALSFGQSWLVFPCGAVPQDQASLNSELSTVGPGPQAVQGLAPMAPDSSKPNSKPWPGCRDGSQPCRIL